MKKTVLIGKLLIYAAAIGAVGYFMWNIMGYLSDPLTTTLAYTYQVRQGVETTGYVVRQEMLLPDEDAGVLHLTRSEGDRVSRHGTVATVYADAAALQAQQAVDELTVRLSQLEYARDAAMADEVAMKLDSQITASLMDYRKSLADRQMRLAQEEGSALQSLILKRDYTHTDAANLEDLIASTKESLREKTALLSASIRSVTTDRSGLWSGSVDGYETVLTPETILTMTPGDFTALQPTQERSNTGKLVLGDTWYYAAVLSQEEADSLKRSERRGKDLFLHFAQEQERGFPVDLHHISQAEKGKCLVVLKGSTYLQDLTMLRRQRCQIVTETTEGLRIPKEALHAQKTNSDGEKTDVVGVYCVVGMESRFKEVEVLYSAEHFVIVHAAGEISKETLRLRPGDEVIVRSRGLYDGKVVG